MDQPTWKGPISPERREEANSSATVKQEEIQPLRAIHVIFTIQSAASSAMAMGLCGFREEGEEGNPSKEQKSRFWEWALRWLVGVDYYYLFISHVLNSLKDLSD